MSGDDDYEFLTSCCFTYLQPETYYNANTMQITKRLFCYCFLSLNSPTAPRMYNCIFCVCLFKT